MQYSSFYLLFCLQFVNGLAKADILESLFSFEDSEPLRCFKCFNITNDLCNKIKSAQSDLVQECRKDATGCVTKYLRTGNYTILSRDCYYHDTGLLFSDTDCDDDDNDKLGYDEAICVKCTDALCNSAAKRTVPIILIIALYLIASIN
ncbi:uncharacterized protein ACN2A1_008756 [Glossina fuscipes fuscipes]